MLGESPNHPGTRHGTPSGECAAFEVVRAEPRDEGAALRDVGIIDASLEGFPRRADPRGGPQLRDAGGLARGQEPHERASDT